MNFFFQIYIPMVLESVIPLRWFKMRLELSAASMKASMRRVNESTQPERN